MHTLLHRACCGLGLLLGAASPALGVPLQPRAAGPRAQLAANLDAALAAGLDAPAARAARWPQRVVVLLVDFPDRPHSASLTPARIDSLFFGAQGSVRDYYFRSSWGRLALSGVVTPWLRLPQSLATYADAAHEGRGVRGAYPFNARRMAEDAVRAADPGVDFSAFDNDGPDGQPSSGDDDGLVDAMIVVHAGSGAETGTAGSILSHTWTTLDVVRTCDGVAAWRYATVAEDSPLGVPAHEFGHLLGLADLYDRRSITLLGGGLGDWSLMASGAWLDAGRTPADLDGASKLEVGFVDAIVPATNGSALPLTAAGAQPGTVYHVWTHGAPGSEYFVLENRQPRGLDAFLPAGGLLVYHVNLQRAHNDEPGRPRVQLLQADGREDIERRINNGDAGDPLPGRLGRLDAGTLPSTRDALGGDTQIALTGITAPTGQMSFDLQVETTPALVLDAHRCGEHGTGNDGDGVPEAGEALRLEVRIRNVGLRSGGITARVRSVPASDVSWGTWEVLLPPLAKADTASASFDFVPRADLGDPARLDFVLEVSAPPGWRDSLTIAAGIGSRTGFQACFGTPASPAVDPCAAGSLPWSVEIVQGGGSWSLVAVAGEFGAVYRSASGPRYANQADVALVSPPFLVQAGSTLRLLHAYQTQDDAAGWAMDGGRVEITMDGAAWEALEPRGGYPRRLQRESVPQLAGAGVFGGSSNRRWDAFDLGPRTGSARLRCRFASGDSIGGSGWELARVEIASGALPDVPGARIEIFAAPNPVRLPNRIVFRIIAPLTWSPRPASLGLYDPRGRLVRRLEHVPVPAEDAWFEWDGTDGGGAPVAAGVYVASLEWGGVHGAAKLLVLR